MRTADSNAVVLDWQRSEGAPCSVFDTRTRSRSRRRSLMALSIGVAALVAVVGTAVIVGLDTGIEADDQFFTDMRRGSDGIANVRKRPQSTGGTQPSVPYPAEPRLAEPVTPDVPPAISISTPRIDSTTVSMIETGSLQTTPTSATRALGSLPPPESASQTQEQTGQVAAPAVPRGRSAVARKVIGTSEASRARNTKWTGTFFDR